MLENSERRYYTEGDINLPNYTWREYPVDFSGNGMITTDRNAAGRYMIIGTTVWWHVDVNFEDVAFNSSNALYITLPMPAAYMTNTCQGMFHDVSTGKNYAINAECLQYDRVAQLFHLNSQQETIPVTHLSLIHI